jgi:hypothetical protein
MSPRRHWEPHAMDSSHLLVVTCLTAHSLAALVLALVGVPLLAAGILCAIGCCLALVWGAA